MVCHDHCFFSLINKYLQNELMKLDGVSEDVSHFFYMCMYVYGYTHEYM